MTRLRQRLRIFQTIQQLFAIQARYVAAHLVLNGTPNTICDTRLHKIGQVTKITWQHNRLTVAGHCQRGPVRLHLGDLIAEKQIAPDDGTFELNLPWPMGLSHCSIKAELFVGDAPPLLLTLNGKLRKQTQVRLQFWGTLIRHLPTALHWYSTHDVTSKARIKRALGLDPPSTGGPLDASIFAASSPRDRPDTPITILLPVYNAYPLMVQCLDRILHHTDLRWRIVIVEDASTDAAVRPFLRAWAANRPHGQVTLIEHEKNLGFMASVNAAFDVILTRPTSDTGPVVLLNSDALVPADWASRLVAPLAAGNVASVTPMSNDAEIASVPAICARYDLADGQAGAIDALARRLSPDHASAPAPTGVGFCMAMNRQYLDQVPRFDSCFGRGYGEEVDWCRKAGQMGGRHLVIANLFVEHRGGASFGDQEKKALVARNNNIISTRYPHYNTEVQDFIRTDPLRSARLALALALAGQQAAHVPIYLAHSMGGGAENWLRTQITNEVERGNASIVLRVGGARRWQLELHGPAGRTSGSTDDFALITRLLEPVRHRRIIYSCGVGDYDPIGLPGHLLALKRDTQCRIEVLFHDYLPISPTYTLLDDDGSYRGPISHNNLAAHSGRDRAHSTRRPDGTEVSLKQWQTEWGLLLHRADLIRVFCQSGQRIVSSVWPELTDRITVKPHDMRVPLIPHVTPPQQKPVLGVLGNIAPHKGAGLVQALTHLSFAQRGMDMVLVGMIDPAFTLSGQVKIHGHYAPTDIPNLIRHYRITHWLIPSVWPETFSFTTHEALATGLPVLAFDLGAQGEAVQRATNGIPLPYSPDAAHLPIVLDALRQTRRVA